MSNLPAKQNQYVEFAEKDSNGKKIDIEGIAQAIENVDDALSELELEVAGLPFNGEIAVGYDGYNPTIRFDTAPKGGLYRFSGYSSGFGYVSFTAPNLVKGWFFGYVHPVRVFTFEGGLSETIILNETIDVLLKQYGQPSLAFMAGSMQDIVDNQYKMISVSGTKYFVLEASSSGGVHLASFGYSPNTIRFATFTKSGDTWSLDGTTTYKLDDMAKVYHLDMVIEDGYSLTDIQYNNMLKANIVIDSDGYIFYHHGQNNEVDYFICIDDGLGIIIYGIDSSKTFYIVDLDDLLAYNNIAKASDVGTKLYKHLIEVGANEITFISNSLTPITALSDLENAFNNGSLINALYYEDNVAEHGSIVGIRSVNNDYEVIFYSFDNDGFTNSRLASISQDTVTPL